MNPANFFNSTAYRYPHERLILALTVLFVFLVIAITATATVCLSVVFVALVIVTSYQFSKSHTQALLRSAHDINPQTSPQLWALAEQIRSRLLVDPLEIFVARSQIPNAYTFGLLSPKVVVIHSILFDLMDQDELKFILGHEMGHVKLGHTWLNSLVGGLAGIPSTVSSAALLELAFRWWNRACEYSADRAGLLACGSPQKAIQALVKLEAGAGGHSASGLAQAIERIEAEDDTLAGSLGELLSTHPMIIRRIAQLQAYARSAQYQRLQTVLNESRAQ